MAKEFCEGSSPDTQSTLKTELRLVCGAGSPYRPNAISAARAPKASPRRKTNSKRALEIKRQIEAGEYRIDLDSLAEKIVEEIRRDGSKKEE